MAQPGGVGEMIKVRDANSPENKTWIPRKEETLQDFEIGPKFSKTHEFRGTILYP